MILNNELERTWRKPTKVLPQHFLRVNDANYEYINPYPAKVDNMVSF